MRRTAALCTALLLPLLAVGAAAATAYVSDELVLGVYAEHNGQGQRLATLHSGAGVDALAVNGEFTQVRLADGTTGWVKTTYLTPRVPAITRVKELEDELARMRATTPALAEAAAHSEAERLKRELADKQAQLDAERGAAPSAQTKAVSAALRIDALTPSRAAKRTILAVIAVPLGLGVGFCLGYATLARRVKQKFGGIKVY